MGTYGKLATAACIAGALVVGSMTPASAACTRLGFEVNDYGKDGPTKDAKDLLDKYIVTKMNERGITNYTVGKKTVNCELFLNLIVVDEHTCKAEATVCWGDQAKPKVTPAAAEKPAASETAKKEAKAESSETKAETTTANSVAEPIVPDAAPKADEQDNLEATAKAAAEAAKVAKEAAEKAQAAADQAEAAAVAAAERAKEKDEVTTTGSTTRAASTSEPAGAEESASNAAKDEGPPVPLTPSIADHEADTPDDSTQAATTP